MAEVLIGKLPKRDVYAAVSCDLLEGTEIVNYGS